MFVASDPVYDLGLVRIPVCPSVQFSPLNLSGKLTKGDRVRVVGCGYGRLASVFDAEITRPFVKGIQGMPDYLAIECRVAPVSGRSGGGLFNQDEELIGVVGYQWPAMDRGFYAHPTAIKRFLVKNKVTSE
jgi:S1-C subfamily serine protease